MNVMEGGNHLDAIYIMCVCLGVAGPVFACVQMSEVCSLGTVLPLQRVCVAIT